VEKQWMKKGKIRTLYFLESWAKSSIRSRNIQKVPPERRNIRANVEATVRLCHRNRAPTGKLRIRGLVRTRVEMICNAIAVNFARISSIREVETETAIQKAIYNLMQTYDKNHTYLIDRIYRFFSIFLCFILHFTNRTSRSIMLNFQMA